MIRPCPTRIDCENENPFVNLSSEGLEANIPPWVPPIAAYWRLFGYCCDSTVVQATSTLGLMDAQDLLAAALVNQCPDCGPPQTFCAQANCPDGSNLTEICVPTSQADADILAEAAETAMAPFCDSKESLFSASCACPDGSNSQTVYSNVSEAVAQAQCDAIPRICPNACNTPQSCTVPCPDGTEFTYAIPACVVYAATVAEADALAHALACQRAFEQRVCLGPALSCICKNQSYSTTIRATGAVRGPISWSILGSLPVGVSWMVSSDTLSIQIIGIPTTSNSYQFTVRATLPGGSFAEKIYHISVIAIATTSVPNYTVGSPYSYQLQTTGGSGNYSWRISAGELPSGLTLSTHGLISGIPDGLNPGSPVTFEVFDLTCEAAQNSVFPPKISLVTNGLTLIKTYLGFPVYSGASTTLYKRVDVTGSHTQIARTAPLVNPVSVGLEFSGGAKETYGGHTQLDIFGNITNRHDKRLTVACNKQPYPELDSFVLFSDGSFAFFPEANLFSLLGYCWEADPNSCSDCSEDELDWIDIGNYASQNHLDFPYDMLIDHSMISASPLVLSYAAEANEFFKRIFPVSNYPQGSINISEVVTTWTRIHSSGNWQFTLSDPFTDQNAIDSQSQYANSSSIAENLPNYIEWTTGFIVHRSSRTTDVSFRLHCTNLIAGKQYNVSYQLWNITAQTRTTITSSFTATGTTEDVIGTVPTPAPGQQIKIQSASIRYA